MFMFYSRACYNLPRYATKWPLLPRSPRSPSFCLAANPCWICVEFPSPSESWNIYFASVKKRCRYQHSVWGFLIGWKLTYIDMTKEYIKLPVPYVCAKWIPAGHKRPAEQGKNKGLQIDQGMASRNGPWTTLILLCIMSVGKLKWEVEYPYYIMS